MAFPFSLDRFPLRTQSRGQHIRLQGKEMRSPFHECRVLRVGQASRGQWEASWKQGRKAWGEEETGLPRGAPGIMPILRVQETQIWP